MRMVMSFSSEHFLNLLLIGWDFDQRKKRNYPARGICVEEKRLVDVRGQGSEVRMGQPVTNHWYIIKTCRVATPHAGQTAECIPFSFR